MIFFFIKTTKHLDIRRDMKKFSPVGCSIDKRQKKSGYHHNKILRMIKREQDDPKDICYMTLGTPTLKHPYPPIHLLRQDAVLFEDTPYLMLVLK